MTFRRPCRCQNFFSSSHFTVTVLFLIQVSYNGSIINQKNNQKNKKTTTSIRLCTTWVTCTALLCSVGGLSKKHPWTEKAGWAFFFFWTVLQYHYKLRDDQAFLLLQVSTAVAQRLYSLRRRRRLLTQVSALITMTSSLQNLKHFAGCRIAVIRALRILFSLSVL